MPVHHVGHECTLCKKQKPQHTTCGFSLTMEVRFIKKLPLSEALLQEPLLKAEIKTSSFLLCPNCGSKYAYDVRQAGPMQAVTECGEKLGTD